MPGDSRTNGRPGVTRCTISPRGCSSKRPSSQSLFRDALLKTAEPAGAGGDWWLVCQNFLGSAGLTLPASRQQNEMPSVRNSVVIWAGKVSGRKGVRNRGRKGVRNRYYEYLYP